MANILIFYFSEKGEVMYDGLSSSLLEEGNNVLRINCFNDIPLCIKNNKETILNLKPDIILSFNNTFPFHFFPREYRKKVYVIDGDNPEYFSHKKELLKYYKELKFLFYQSDSKNFYNRIFNIEIPNKNSIFFPSATSIKSKKLKQDKNISFIGTNFSSEYQIRDKEFYSKVGISIYNSIKANYFLKPKDLYDQFKDVDLKEEHFNNLFFSVKDYHIKIDRIKNLNLIYDLGLIIYGVRWNSINTYFDFDIASCYDNKKIVTLEDNEWVYNTSKIAVNVSHPQAKSSFSWRVMDIMASNACLLMERKPDWDKVFGKYISNEVKNSIIYKDRYDMRKKAIELLSNDALRLKCIKECQNAIEKNGCWKHRLKNLETFSKKTILSNRCKGNIKFIKLVKNNIFNEGKYQINFIKKNYHLITNCIRIAIISVLPIKISIKISKIKRIIHRMNKYRQYNDS